MLRGSRIAVVVPAHNEASWIAETLETMPTWVDDVLVVDDGSTDRTSAIALSVATRLRDRLSIQVLRHPSALGVGAAIISGYRRAIELGVDVAAVMAGDGQMHPDDLAAVVDPAVLGADYVKGNRLHHPTVWRTMPTSRLIATRVLGWLTARAAGIDDIVDGQCGFTAMRVDSMRSLELDRIWTGYGYPNDLIAGLALAKLRIVEVDVRPVYRGEHSGLRVLHVGIIGGLIGRAYLRRITSSTWQRSSSPPDARANPNARENAPAQWLGPPPDDAGGPQPTPV